MPTHPPSSRTAILLAFAALGLILAIPRPAQAATYCELEGLAVYEEDPAGNPGFTVSGGQAECRGRAGRTMVSSGGSFAVSGPLPEGQARCDRGAAIGQLELDMREMISFSDPAYVTYAGDVVIDGTSEARTMRGEGRLSDGSSATISAAGAANSPGDRCVWPRPGSPIPFAMEAVISEGGNGGDAGTAPADGSGPCGDLIVGTDRADRLIGGGTGESIRGLRGADRISGAAGVDCLDGGPGRDRAAGGPGDDLITGGRGRDRLSGGGGNDRIDARDGHGGDRVNCGGGGRDIAYVDRGDRTRNCETVGRG